MSSKMGPTREFSKYTKHNKNTLRKSNLFSFNLANRFNFLNVFLLRSMNFENLLMGPIWKLITTHAQIPLYFQFILKINWLDQPGNL